jgi:hypothetical protein
MTEIESTVIESPVEELLALEESLFESEPMLDRLRSGLVYTETVVYAAPAEFVADAPYQLAIVELDGGGRLTGRIEGDRVEIGDAVRFGEYRNGVPFFRKA